MTSSGAWPDPPDLISLLQVVSIWHFRCLFKNRHVSEDPRLTAYTAVGILLDMEATHMTSTYRIATTAAVILTDVSALDVVSRAQALADLLQASVWYRTGDESGIEVSPHAAPDRHGVRLDTEGYVSDYDCHHNHSGNTGYVHQIGEHYACQGCGQSVHASTIRAVQAGGRLDIHGNVRS